MKNRLVASGACLAVSLGLAHSRTAASSARVDVSTVPQLQAAVAGLTSGQVIRIAPGRYALTQQLRIRNGVTNVALVGATGNRGDVVIVGSGMNTPGVNIAIKVENAQDVRIADLSVGEAFEHPIQLQGEQGAERVHVSNVRLFDAGQQFLKSTVDYSAVLNGVDDVIVENSLFEFTVIGPPDGYTQGIDAHHAANWIIRNNVFRNIRVPPGATFLNRPGVLMWGGSRNTTVAGNTFINCERGIIFGQGGQEFLGNSHSGGLIVNNFIYRTEPQHADAGISVWDSPGTRVYHNTVIQNGTYPAAIEYRFASTTGVEIINNLTDGLILQRDGASAVVTNNYTAATPSLFVNPAAGDLHLLPTATVAIDQGRLVGVAVDRDGGARPMGAAPDLGADELANAAPQTPAQSLFTTQTPAVPNYTDGTTYELGVRLRSDTAGQITAIRYWKAPSDTGSHVGRIWSAGGQVLASVTFTGETASGWQQQALATPLSIAANTEYVVSVPTGPAGYLVATLNAFPLTNGHLQGLEGRWAPVGSFPSGSSPHNYFRDVVFVLDGSGTDPPASQTLVTTEVPAIQNYTDGTTYELGVRLRSDTAGQITAIRYWKAPSDTGSHVGRIWSAGGQLLASVTFTGETASGWQQQALATPLSIAANTDHVVSVPTGPAGYLVATLNAFPLANGHLQGLDGRWAPVGSFPSGSTAHNYFRDVVFTTGTGPPDTTPPTVSITQPANGSMVSGAVTIAAAASDDVGVAGVQFQVDGVNFGGEITLAPYSVVWNSTTATNGSHTLTAVARDAAGHQTPASVTVTVNNGAPLPSQTLLTTQVPTVANYTDGTTYELGVRLRSDTTGQITAIRYWKAPSDAGSHVGRIWSAGGQLLASVTFTGETASGWQQQVLATPLAIAANTEYVVSVPTGPAGYLVATLNAFPLANGHLQGLDGRWAAVGSFPSGSSPHNYFRDVVFVPDGGAIQIQLTHIVSGLSSPLFVGHAGDNSGRLFIVERGGVIQVLQPGATTPTVFLNITSRVQSTGSEQGLLGLAFHPLYESNGRFFVFYTRSGGEIVVAEYHVSADPNVADPAEEILLTIPHAANTNHNGGMLAFGPDNYLYVGVGDGGGSNDGPNNAQNLTVLLGKILRIDIDVPVGQTYVSPPSNPFVGVANTRAEIFAYGLRNPWRFSFDRAVNDLWVADVGQGAREEVNSRIVGGGNYGWRIWEGFACTNNDPALCGSQAGYNFPVFDYGHTGGRCSITGGYVYRGLQGTVANGTYVYGDYCSGEIFGWTGGPSQAVLLDTALNISSFGEDESGELYVVGLGGTVSRIVSGAPPPGTIGNDRVTPESSRPIEWIRLGELGAGWRAMTARSPQ